MIEVSVVTPTYNRRKFIPTLIEIYKSQTFPKDKMEWIIVDDGRDKVEDLFKEASKSIPNIRYIYSDEKLRLGAKRNVLNEEAKGNIIIAMDDDDYYPPDRVQTVVNAFLLYPSIDLVGSSAMLLYYVDLKKIYMLGQFSENHATNGTMAWRNTYAEKHTYDEYVTHAEERSFLDEYSHPMIQLDPFKVMLVMSHSENTFDKKKMREVENNPLVKKTGMKLTDFIKEKELCEFFKNA
jgi:glycosyltransferase involved in cell wall biosynthesis